MQDDISKMTLEDALAFLRKARDIEAALDNTQGADEESGDATDSVEAREA